MHDLYFVHGLETSYRLNEYLPDLSFFNICFVFFVLTDFLKHVTIVGKLHYDAKKGQQLNYAKIKCLTYHKLLLFSSRKASLY